MFLDESYIHQGYCCKDDSLYNPNDAQDVFSITGARNGRRWCFALAIQEADPCTYLLRHPQHLTGVVLGTQWIFNPGSKATVAARGRNQKVRSSATIKHTDPAAICSFENPVQPETLTATGDTQDATQYEDRKNNHSNPYSGDYHKSFNSTSFKE